MKRNWKSIRVTNCFNYSFFDSREEILPIEKLVKESHAWATNFLRRANKRNIRLHDTSPATHRRQRAIREQVSFNPINFHDASWNTQPEFPSLFTWHRSFDKRYTRGLGPLLLPFPIIIQDSLLFSSGEPVKSSFRASTYTQKRGGRGRRGHSCDLADMLNWSWTIREASCSLVLLRWCVYIPDWIPEKGRRDGVKGLPFARRSPAATASTGTLIFDLGRSPFSVHVYSIPTECFFLPWTSLVAARIASDRTDIMDSSPSTPYFSLPSPVSRFRVEEEKGRGLIRF